MSKRFDSGHILQDQIHPVQRNSSHAFVLLQVHFLDYIPKAQPHPGCPLQVIHLFVLLLADYQA